MTGDEDLIGTWEGGTLRVFMPLGHETVEIENLAREYTPIGDGWAIRADRPFPLPSGIPGVTLLYDLRDGRLACVAVRSDDGGPAIGAGLLRRLEPLILAEGRALFASHVVRLVVRDGVVGGELPFARPSAGRFVNFAEPNADVTEEAKKREPPKGRPGRPPLSDARLDRVAELYREARLQGISMAERCGKEKEFRGYSHATIRNWVRRARKREKLPPVDRSTPDPPTTKED